MQQEKTSVATNWQINKGWLCGVLAISGFTGFLIPVVVLVYVLLVSNHLDKFIIEIFNTSFFILSALSAIPFLLLAFIVILKHLFFSTEKEWAELCLSYFFLIVFIALPYYYYWRDLYILNQVSSTGCLIFIFVPFYGCFGLVFFLILLKILRRVIGKRVQI